jgi:protein-disulfide isomerase
MLSAAAILASAACNAEKGSSSTGAASAEVKPVKPPANGDWSEIVAATPAGGFVMGNPNAGVKLVEYGSYTCGHCATFDAEGAQPLIDKYVKTGQVSYEYRNYVRDPYDLAGALIARCNGEKSFFPLTHAMFQGQKDWMGKLQTVSPEQQQALGGLGPDKQFLEIAKLAGFQQWAAMRGVPTAKSTTCLTNETEINRLVQMNGDATTQYPDFAGTPTFILNGELVKGATWEILETELRKAIG